MTRNELLKQARKLDIDERTVLAHLIWMSVEDECAGHEGEMSDELKRKIDERLDAIKKNPYDGCTLEEFMRKFRAKQARRKKARV